MSKETSDGYNSGSEMWRDNAANYGVITARIIGSRYLELQAQTTDESERAFCRELREAMAMERNFTDVAVYLHSVRLAEYNGEAELYKQSDRLNRRCAGDIDDAIHACEYGDGTHDYKYALAALVEQYGMERVNIVLAAEAKWLGFAGKVSNDIYEWARGFNLREDFYGGFHLRTRPAILSEFIGYMRDAPDISLGAAFTDNENMEVDSMSENNKTIRFITSGYKELFQIPDGGSIKITYPPEDGREPVTRACKYLDEVHFRTLGRGGDTYHACQFAEIMERLGAKYEPEAQLRDAELNPFTKGDERFYTYNREEGNSCVGHISGDFGNGGDRFHSGWHNHKTKSEQDWSDVSPEFQSELHSAIYALRQDLLKDCDSMLSYCENHPEALIDSGSNYRHYGFKLETDTRQYYTQCFLGESMRDARFIMYAYENPAPEHEQAQPAYGVVLPASSDEQGKFYRDDTDNLCMGYLRGDHGRNGTEFHHSWFDGENGRNTPEFKAEFQTVMETLRHDVLKDRKSSERYCNNHPEAKLTIGGFGHHYGFKMETETRQFFVRCTMQPNDYFYVFAFDKNPAREQERSVEKPSVLKQIRDAEKTPKPPRKAKSPDKRKDGAEL